MSTIPSTIVQATMPTIPSNRPTNRSQSVIIPTTIERPPRTAPMNRHTETAASVTVPGEVSTPMSTPAVIQSQQNEQAEPRPKPRPPRACLCGVNHLFLDCPYIIPSQQPQGWKPDPTILVHVHNQIQENQKLKAIITRFRKKYHKDKKADQQIIELFVKR